jgi:hypothetical protein
MLKRLKLTVAKFHKKKKISRSRKASPEEARDQSWKALKIISAG